MPATAICSEEKLIGHSEIDRLSRRPGVRKLFSLNDKIH
jgi:hypothetical protein